MEPLSIGSCEWTILYVRQKLRLFGQKNVHSVWNWSRAESKSFMVPTTNGFQPGLKYLKLFYPQKILFEWKIKTNFLTLIKAETPTVAPPTTTSKPPTTTSPPPTAKKPATKPVPATKPAPVSKLVKDCLVTGNNKEGPCVWRFKGKFEILESIVELINLN